MTHRSGRDTAQPLEYDDLSVYQEAGMRFGLIRSTSSMSQRKMKGRGWAEWALELADHMGMTPTEMILQSLERIARESDFPRRKPSWRRPSLPDFIRPFQVDAHEYRKARGFLESLGWTVKRTGWKNDMEQFTLTKGSQRIEVEGRTYRRAMRAALSIVMEVDRDPCHVQGGDEFA